MSTISSLYPSMCFVYDLELWANMDFKMLILGSFLDMSLMIDHDSQCFRDWFFLLST